MRAPSKSRQIIRKKDKQLQIIKKTKVLTLSAAILIVFGILSQTAFTSEDFAPVAKFPKNLKEKDYWVKLIKGWKIPSKETVGVPAYPGAKIAMFMPASTMTANENKIETFPVITLGSTDSQDKIVAFYKENLKDWKYKNSFSMFDIFWQGPDDFNNMDMEQAAVTIHVVIFEATIPLELMPETKTQIQINYKTDK